MVRRKHDVNEWVADPVEFIYNAIVLPKLTVILEENDSKRALGGCAELTNHIGRRGQNKTLQALFSPVTVFDTRLARK